MKLRYNYRLYPNKSQEHLMKNVGGTCRWLWDRFLEENIKKYEEEKKFIHQVSHRIAKYGVLVCAETLNIKQMNRNHPVAIAIGDAGWAMLFDNLRYKSDLRGGFFYQINQWLASSKTCNSCGHKKEKLSLDERTYSCDSDSCEYENDRDINAALNIRD